MNERPHLFKPKRQSLGLSPTRQKASDDILAELTPAAAVEALLSPVGAIKGCMDLATPAEKEFAMRTAMASQRICEWLQELRDWKWPAELGPAGFENQTLSQRRLFTGGKDSTEERDDKSTDYMGCLRVEEVARYAWRVEKIQRDMEELGVEDIKAHILTNHILPLSRPTTPASDTSRQSINRYNKMEDLSAIVMAMIVQTLPNLARLSRLLQIWAMRLTVLQHLSPFLHAMDEAERTLEAGWDSVLRLSRELAELSGLDETQKAKFSLGAESFAVMKKFVTRKVAKPGRTIDFMLDCLEGMDDTLPDDWLDRMESVENSYSEWVAVGERKLREAEWATVLRGHASKRLSDSSVSVATAEEFQDDESELEGLEEGDSIADVSTDMSTPDLARKETPRFPPSTAEPAILVKEAKAKTPARWSAAAADDDTLDSPMSPVKEEEDEEEPDLPPLRDSERLDSDDLLNDTVLHGASSQIDGMFSEPPEVSRSPTGLRGPIRTQQFPQDSPPSSPPRPEDGRGDSSMLMDSPTVGSVAEFDDSVFTRTPADGSFTEDYDDSFSVPETSSPRLRRESVGEQHLRKQLTQIIEGIPAKIKLSPEAPTVNLNPPDLQLPRLKKKSSKDQFKRSTSSMSSRTTTPSFTLTPAKNSRPRHQRGQQEIKVYHLSRSTGEAPIKLFIRCVGENGERVMVRVGGGWADLSEYLKEYASHHGRRSGRAEDTTVEVRDLPQNGAARPLRETSKEPDSSPPSRPGSAAAENAPFTPITMRKKRRSAGASNIEVPKIRPKTPATAARNNDDAPPSADSAQSRSSSRLSWVEDDSSFLGLAGPSSRRVEMSDESKAWVESVKEKVRLASGERKVSATEEKRFGELGRVGGTKRLFRKADARDLKR